MSVWGLEGDLDVADAASNTFELEWPRGSGQLREFPEVDRVEWVSVDQARRKLVKGQRRSSTSSWRRLRPRHDRVEPGPARRARADRRFLGVLTSPSGRDMAQYLRCRT